MAIKKRTRAASDPAAIEAFGDAADLPLDQATNTNIEPRTTGSAEQDHWPEGMSKTFLVRYPDPAIPLAIEELQSLVGRNKQQTTLLALRRGIEVLRREAESLGDKAELLS